MKVVIDISPLKSGHQFRGIGRYTKNLLESLQKFDKKNQYISVDKPGEVKEADIVHYPYFDPFFPTLPLIKKSKTIVTIHDLIPLVFPEHYPPGIRGKINWFRQKLSLKGVKLIVTDSESSKKDIVRFTGFSEEKIRVVYLAPTKNFQPIKNHRFLKSIKVKYSLPDRFILYVGDINYNKNVLGLVKAAKLAGVPLVIIGKQAVTTDFDRKHPENQPLVELIDQYGKDPQVIRLGYIPDEDLIALYNLASVYCQPSYCEGSGLPVLEAMACGCPVVASNNSSLVEICGQAAVMINPEKPVNIKKGISRVLQDQQLRKRLIKRGFELVKNFSWQKTAAEMVAIYQEVFNE